MAEHDRARITVWSDYVCPFCYLEEPVLERIREEYGNGVEIHWRAFELRPEPVPPSIPMESTCTRSGAGPSTRWRSAAA